MTRSYDVDAGETAPDPGSPMNRRILAALNEAVSRGDSAHRTLDAVDAVLSERAESSKRAAASQRPAAASSADGLRRRHARPASRARAEPRLVETPANLDSDPGRERSTCGEPARDETAREKVA